MCGASSQCIEPFKNMPLMIRKVPIERVEYYLGVWLDPQLKWNTNTTNRSTS